MDGSRAAPLSIRVKLEPAGITYGGRLEFNQKYGTDMVVSGSVDVVWTPKRVASDVITYVAAGQFNGHFVVTDCEPADQVVTLEGTASQMTRYTASNAAFANQYSFTVVTNPTVTLSCQAPGQMRTTVMRAVGAVLTGGLCHAPPFLSYTDENVLAGTESCPMPMTTSSWSFRALDAP